MGTIPSNLNFPTKNQIPDHSIMDFYNKQAYLGNQFIDDPGVLSLADSSEHPLLYILCPATSGKSLFISDLNLNAVGATDVITYRVYHTPTTVAAGTSVTPRNIRIASSTTSLATVKSGVTAVSNGTLLQIIVATVNTQVGHNPLYILDPGKALLITGQAASTASAICVATHYEL